MKFRKNILFLGFIVLAVVQSMHGVVPDTVIGCINGLACNFSAPNAIAITPDGSKAYVCNSNGNSVIAIDVANNTIIGCVDVPEAYSSCGFTYPKAIAITPEGSKAYVCNNVGSVSVINVATDTVVGCVDVPGAYSACGFNNPVAIAITPDGSKAYVCNEIGNSVSVIDVATDTVVGCVDVPGAYSACGFNNPVAIAITPNGSKAYVCNNVGSVSVVDVATNTVVGCVDVPGAYASCFFNLPGSIAITPDGSKAYVCNTGNNTVTAIDVATDTVVGCVDVPGAYSACGFNRPQAIAITTDGSKAYVCNPDSNTVSVIDVATNTVIDCVDVPEAYSACGFNNPVAIAITPYGTEAYVCNINGYSVSVIEVASDKAIGCVHAPGVYSACEIYEPQTVAITPNGKKAYVCNWANNSVSVINVASDTVVGCVDVPGAYSPYCGFNAPQAIAITPNGEKAYVCNTGNNSVSVINVASDTVVGCVDVPAAYSPYCGFNAPQAIAITPNGEKAYVCNTSYNSVSVIDVASDTVIGCVDVPGVYSSYCGFNGPQAVAITTDGSKAYVCNADSNTVSVIDVVTDTVIGCVDVPGAYSACGFNNPLAIAITPNGEKAYVCNSFDGIVSVINVETDSVIRCVDVPGAYSACGFNNPVAIAITPDGSKIYVCNYNGGGSVSVVDVASDTVIGCVDVPDAYSACSFNGPQGIAITPNGAKAYVCNYNGNSISIIAAQPPLAPTNLSGCILQQGTTITNTLVWDAPTSGFLPTSYQVYRGATLIATVPGYGYGPFEYEDARLNPNMTYTYNIYSVYDGITSDPATITLSVFCYPELFPPSGLSSSCSLDKNYTITWEVPTSGATPVEYEIYSDASLTHLVATVLAYGYDSFMYELTGLDPNMSYIYYIVSVDGYGDKSQPASVTVGPCISILPPASINGCKMQNRFLLQTDYINNITWTAPASGSSPVAYKIYRNAGLTQLVATVSASGSLQYYDHNRNPNDVYNYYIVSVDVNGNVSTANSVTVTQSC